MILNDAPNVMYGNENVDSIYLGNELVWGGSGLLPKEYRQLEYVRSTGEQYIDTLYQYGVNFHADLMYEYTDIPTTEVDIFGNWTDNGEKSHFTFGIENGVQRLVCYDSLSGFPSIQDGQPIANTMYNVELNNICFLNPPHTMKINDQVYTNNSGRFVRGSDENFFIFCNGGVKRFLSSIKLYRLIFYNTDYRVKACEFIPAQRKSDGKVGLYDVVREQFFTSNSGVDLLPPA